MLGDTVLLRSCAHLIYLARPIRRLFCLFSSAEMWEENGVLLCTHEMIEESFVMRFLVGQESCGAGYEFDMSMSL